MLPGHDQLPLGFELGPFLRHHSLRLRDLRLARFIGEDGDDVVLLDHGPPLDPKIGQRPPPYAR